MSGGRIASPDRAMAGHVSGIVPERQRHEQTPADKAQAAQAVADNLDRYQQFVGESVAAMATAAVAEDRAGWLAAKKAAESALAQVRDAVRPALTATADAADEATAQRLAGAQALLDNCSALLATAAVEPTARTPALSCEVLLLSVLPPDGPVDDAKQVYDAAERAIAGVFHQAMTFSDIGAFQALLRDHPHHEVSRRFARLDRARRARLVGLLEDSKVRARARAHEAARHKLASAPPAPQGFQDRHLIVGEGANAAGPAVATGIDGAVESQQEPTPSIVAEGARGSLPHRREMEASFGADFSGVEAQVGVGALRDDLGAEAVAHGHTVAFADAAPSAPLVAHELTHVVQQDGAGSSSLAAKRAVSAPGDAAEVEAEAVEAAVARGEPASTVAISAAPTAALHRRSIVDAARDGATVDPDRDAARHLADAQGHDINARAYVQLHRDQVLGALTTLLAGRTFSTGHAGLAWTDEGRFRAHVIRRLNVAGADAFIETLRSVVAPVELWGLVDRYRLITKVDLFGTVAAQAGHDVATQIAAARGKHQEGPVGPSPYVPGVGAAVASEVEKNLLDSIARMGPRYFHAARLHQHDAAAQGVETPSVEQRDLIPGHPLDWVVAGALCEPEVVEVTAGPEDIAPGALDPNRNRRIAVEWQGARGLWNYVKVTAPSDPTPEEVAKKVLGRHDLAYRLTVVPPLYGIPEDLAEPIDEARAFRPAALGSRPACTLEPSQEGALAVAGSAFADEIALAQSADAQAAAPTVNQAASLPPDRDDLLATIDRGLRQLDLIAERLMPWRIDALLLAAQGWLSCRAGTLGLATPEEVARWAPVLAGQQAILFEAAGGLAELLEMAEGSGVAGPAAPQAGPFAEAITAYATAMGESHLVDTAAGQLARGRKLRGMIPLALLAGSLDDSRQATLEISATQPGLGAHSEASGARAEQADLEEQFFRMQQQAIRGEPVDAEMLDAIALRAAEHSFVTRMTDLGLKARMLGPAIDKSDDDGGEMILNRLDGDLPGLRVALDDVIRTTDAIRLTRDGDLQAAELALDGPERAAELSRLRHQALARKQQDFEALRVRAGLDQLFSRIIDEVEDAQVRALIFDIAAMIGISIVSAGVASGVAGAVRGSMMAESAIGTARFLAMARRARLVSAGVGMVTEAGLNAVGQTVLQGGDFGDVFLENLATDAAVLGALRPIHALAASWGMLDEAAMGLWQRVGRSGKFVLKGAVLTAEMVTAGAVSYVAQRLIHGAPPGDQDTLMQWALQGASMAVGRFVAGRASGVMERMDALGAEAGDLLMRARRQKARAKRVEDTGDKDAALELLGDEHALLVEEAALLQRMADDPEARQAAGLKSSDVERLARGNAETQGQVSDVAFQELPLRVAGLQEDITGLLWSGTSEEIAIALHQAQRAGIDVEVLGADTAGRRWEIQLGGRRLFIHEKPLDGRGRDVKEDVTPASAAEARRYAEAAVFLQERFEAHIKADLESRAVIELEYLQVGDSIAGVINQRTHPAGQGFQDKLILYRDRGTLGGRGDLQLGQKPDALDGPGIRVSEQTADRDRYATSAELGGALDIGRFENQVPAYQGELIGFERRPAEVPADWKAPGRAMRVRVKSATGERWVYVDRLDYAGGLGPTQWEPTQKMSSDVDFKSLRADGLLLAGDDPQLSGKLKGAERVLVLGGSPTGAWAAEDAVRQGAKGADLMGDARSPADRAKFADELRAAQGDPTQVAEIMGRYRKAAHGGEALARNRQPGAAYDNSAVQIEIGTPTRIEPTGDGRVKVTMGDGAVTEIRIYDKVVAAHGPAPQAAGGPERILGKPGSADAIELQPIFEDGVLVGLESIDPPGIRLVGAAYTRLEVGDWVIRDRRSEFLEGVGKLAAAGYETHTGRRISSDSTRVAGGIEAQADAIPRANEVLARAAFQLSSRHRLRLALDSEMTWDNQVADFLISHLRGHPDRVRVQRQGSGSSSIVAFSVSIGGVDVGVARVDRSTDHVELDGVPGSESEGAR